VDDVGVLLSGGKYETDPGVDSGVELAVAALEGGKYETDAGVDSGVELAVAALEGGK